MSAVVKGQVPAWLSLDRLRTAIAPMMAFAVKHGATVTIECELSTVHIQCVTTAGTICAACGVLVEKRVKRVSILAGRRDAQQCILISLCDTCREGES